MSELKVNKISPATGTDFTLGDSGDVFTVPSGATITNSGTANGFGGGGKLLAYIPTTSAMTLAAKYSTTSTSFVDVTGATESITPSATSSKVLVMVNCAINNVTGGYSCFVRLLRGSTVIATGATVGSSEDVFGFFEGSAGSSGSWCTHCSVSYIDSPSSTSAVAYKLQIKVNGGTGWIGGTSGSGNGVGSVGTNITLVELSGA